MQRERVFSFETSPSNFPSLSVFDEGEHQHTPANAKIHRYACIIINYAYSAFSASNAIYLNEKWRYNTHLQKDRTTNVLLTTQEADLPYSSSFLASIVKNWLLWCIVIVTMLGYVSALNLIASSRRVSSRNSWLIVWVNTAPGWRLQLVITWCIKLQRCSRWCGTSVPWGLCAKWRLKKTTVMKQINSFQWVTD